MKKKSAAKSSKKAAKPEKAPKKVSAIEELKTRNMRLTQEFDRLSTRVAAQGELLYQIHQTLMTRKMMPYDPIINIFGTTEKPGVKIVDPSAKGGRPSPAMFASTRGEIKGYVVSLKNQQTLLGYLAGDASWTLDPKKIFLFENKESAQGVLSNAKVPEAAKASIDERRNYL